MGSSLISHQHQDHRFSVASATSVFALLYLIMFFASATTNAKTLSISHDDSPHGHHQLVLAGDGGGGELESVVSSRRLLSGTSSGVLWWVLRLGSSPPTCRSKCGRCWPCRAVHVPIQPGRMSVPLEYYPEAWRCKCKNKLFMP